MSEAPSRLANNPALGIGFIVLGMFCISINDMLVKLLSGGYPLHQMVFVRSLVGITFSFVILHFEGGLAALRTDRPWLHLARGLLIVFANLTYFAALAAVPLADATAIFFVAPLFITLLSIPLLGEKVGIRRLSAVVIGFFGVLIMMRPGVGDPGSDADRLVLILPILAALAYAAMQILTRRLGAFSTASAMALYLQATFLAVGALFWLVAGDGRFAEGLENESAIFLLRAWTWPTPKDWLLFGLLGAMSAVVGYALSQAYRSADAATVAPFEYVALPMAIFWGWTIFGDFPDAWVLCGILLIVGSGVYVFLRERQKQRESAD